MAKNTNQYQERRGGIVLKEINQEYQCDLVVLGGGGSGLVAAVRAAGLTGKQIIVLEKTGVTGGGANFATFMRTFDSQWQEKRGISCQTVDYLRLVQDEMYWQCDPELASNALRATGQFVDWLIEMDPSVDSQVYPGKYLFPNQFDPVGPQSDNHNKRTFGKIVMDTMAEQCAALGIQVLTRTQAESVEMQDGRISAIIARGPQGLIRVRCRACILATGSWICNETVAKKVCPEFSLSALEPGPHTNPAYTGDGIPIAEQAGALVDYSSFCIRFMGPMPPRNIMHNPIFQPIKAMLQSPYIITVNQAGKRYCSEPLSHMKAFEDGVVQSRQPNLISYQIFDTNCIEAAGRLPRKELDKYMLEVMGDPNVNPDLCAVEKQMEAIFTGKHPNIFRSDTLEELADQIGVEKDEFLDTIVRYNRACSEGIDWDFAKPTDALVPLQRAPFYAVRTSPGTDGAFGGVRVNGRMEAFAADGQHIVEGLYAAGDFTSGRYVVVGGYKRQLLNDLSWAFASGFLAGTNAARYLTKQ